jgi:hypothetical protein
MDQLAKTTHFESGSGPRGDPWVSLVHEEPVWDDPFLRDSRRGARGLRASVCQRGQSAAKKSCHRKARDIPTAGAWLRHDSPEGRFYWEALR